MTTRLFVSSALVLALVACGSAGPGDDSTAPPDAQTANDTSAPVCAGCTPAAGAAAPAAGGGSAAACPYTGTPLDTSAFKQEDCGTDMLCLGAALVGPDLAKQLKPCSTGVCVPKKSVAAAGNYLPKTCASIGNAEGRCLNVGIPAVGAQAGTLPVADCDQDERCSPCFDPISGAATGSCSTVSCDKPAKPAAASLATCCGGKATCVPKAGVPSDLQSSLDGGSCAASGDLCVPNEYVKDPNFQPKACNSSLPFIGGKGACVSKCLPDTDLLETDGCGPDDVCAPCSEMPAGTTVCNK